jgi:glutathione synthase/RimK-type ligase-like ATP-grasp enzyme
MRKKNFVVYYRKKKFAPDPFFDFGEKRDVYYDFFALGHKKGYNMFLSSGDKKFRKGLKFFRNLIFDGKKFVHFRGKITADAVLDRSGSLSFPSKKIGTKVLNPIEFKTLCADKFATFKYLGKLMADSYLIKNKKDLKENIKHFSEDELVVLKPVGGMQGKGIVVSKASKIIKKNLRSNKEYVLQKFVDTSKGITGIVGGLHDLRVVIVGGKIVWCHVRQPKKGTYLANVALGGSIKEIRIDEIPSYVLKAVRKIQKLIDKKYNFPLYSIDFGVSGKKPFVFELNDQIGFPRKDMKNKNRFIESIMKSLERLSAS